MSRPCYRSVLSIVVLSRERIDDWELGDILRETDEGDMVMGRMTIDSVPISRLDMDYELRAAGSDPEFWSEEEEEEA